MPGRVGLVVAVVVAVLAVVGGVWFWGMRTKVGPILDLQRRINRRVVNPRQMRTAGTPGAYAGVVHHRGRRSGAPYATPVVPFPTDDGFAIVLPYGTRPDWVRNVLAAGAATLVHEGHTYEVAAPEVVAVNAAPCDFPDAERRGMRRFGNTQCLVVHLVASSDDGSVAEAAVGRDAGSAATDG